MQGAEIADFSSMARVSWTNSNAMTRLVVCAIVCNKAKFTEGSDNNEKGENESENCVTCVEEAYMA